MLVLCHSFAYTIAEALAICLCDTDIIELTTFVNISFISTGTKYLFLAKYQAD